MDDFWNVIAEQVAELRTAKNADEVLHILRPERNPYGPEHSSHAFFAGSGGDDSVMEALRDAGWTVAWAKASYYFVMQAQDGSKITYVEGDVYKGDTVNTDPKPGEGDGIIELLRGKYSTSLGAAHLGDYETAHEACYWLAREMDLVQVWPNAWTISDGNAHLIVLDKAVSLQPDELDKLRERLATGADVTVTYERDGDHHTVSGFVDWDYVAMADLDPEERDDTVAVIAGTTGPRFLIHFDNLLAVTID